MDSNDDRYIRAIVKEEIAKSMPHNSNSTHHKKKKGNREPTKWQIFLGDCSKKQHKDMSMGDKVKACSIQYKKIKESNPRLLDDMVTKIQSQNTNHSHPPIPPINQQMNQPQPNYQLIKNKNIRT